MAKYKAETGEGRKSVAVIMHINNIAQNIIMAAPYGDVPGGVRRVWSDLCQSARLRIGTGFF
ncbi:hypothetical protein [Bifidobacterium sp. B4142]|uniref:hypothetical protein n=1 Tax=Bifidobacterium sp. B4142 TaxID=2817962 RepID=UPI00226BAD9C|nr:hypothetical protein [Bifidobacterium sp. B4142]MCX8686577.1 hypothetical protein [Bifidobacterium sp. B4142]